ncbi:hypothetical protein KJA14_01375 [Patescibacteria group bacterium]|nr:hypothetical protein [Patescibacteria group bacterium]
MEKERETLGERSVYQPLLTDSSLVQRKIKKGGKYMAVAQYNDQGKIWQIPLKKEEARLLKRWEKRRRKKRK